MFPPRQQAAIIGDPGAIMRKVPMVATLRPRRDELRRCLGPGILMGREDMRPASLRNATMEPVNVTPPIRIPRYPVTRCNVEMSPICAMTLPKLVITAARPTTEWRAATVWGRSVAVVFRPIRKPVRVSTARVKDNYHNLPTRLPKAATPAN